MNRIQNTKLILWLITGFAAAVGLIRFVFGLGVTTNLTDSTPWGLWIGFDVMGGVALASGGFVLTAIVYIMKQEEFHPLVKPAVLTAFLGYLAVIFGLLFDVGLPWNLWHMLIYWNPQSPLFEVGWCVMLYTAVLLLEFSPVPLETYSRYAKIRNFLMRFRFIFVLLGIMLSTLHQSSLGSLFLVMPFKLHPLWYSNILPVQFFISAIALGLMMVSLESLVSHWLYRYRSENKLLEKLAKAAVWVLLLYLLVKMIDIIATGKFAMIYDGSWESYLFISEMLISVLIPAFIFLVPRFRQDTRMQFVGSLMVVLGMVFNRINVGGLTMLSVTGDSYIPSWMEISISLGVISAAILVFLFVVEHFHIWEKQPRHPESGLHTPPVFDHISNVWLGSPQVAAVSKYSLAFLISFALGIALMPDRQIHSRGIENITVRPANGKNILHINGNRDQFNVEFPHKEHIGRIGENKCIECHHLNLPRCEQNNCWECHTNMYQSVDFFGHGWHASEGGANLECSHCHKKGQTRNTDSAKKCFECHQQYQSVEFVDNSFSRYNILSYTDAMHKLCVSCHTIKSKETNKMQNLAKCATCHENEFPEELAKNLKWETSLPNFNRVILPVIDEKKIEKSIKALTTH